MPYITREDYLEEYRGEEIGEEDFLTLERRAAGIVEEMTRYRLTEESFSAMAEKMKAAVKKAVCAQVQYLEANGGAELDNSAELLTGTLGKFSFSKGASEKGQRYYAPGALRLLAPTGLLYKGGGL